MTRKDFVAIASAIGLISNPKDRQAVVDKICEHIVEVAPGHPRFNRPRFEQYVEDVAASKEGE